MYQRLRAVYHEKDLHIERRNAEALIAMLPTCPIPEVARLERTLRRWKDSKTLAGGGLTPPILR